MNTLSVVKIGGNVLDQPDVLSAFLADFASLPAPKILVHGGGKAASDLSARLGVPVQKHQGRRLTDAPTLDVAVMTYAGRIGKGLAAHLQARGTAAISLCGADGDLLRATRRPPVPIDFGFVGDLAPAGVNTRLLETLLAGGYVPVLSAITHDGAGQLLNTNADTIAATVAAALAPHFSTDLLFIFEKPGLLADASDNATLIPHLNQMAYERLVATGVINDGMLPKTQNAFAALVAGVQRVIIGGPAALQPGAAFTTLTLT